MKKFFNIVLLTIGLSFFNSCFIIDDDSYRLTLSSVSEKMIVGESITLKATVSGFRTVTPEIEWSSNDPNIATVDEKGVVKAIKKGETTIVAKITYSIQARCKIIVTEDFTITFADSNFEKYCLNNFDENKDGKISGTEAKIVKIMDFHTDNIKSMGEIRYFTNLEFLGCDGSGSDDTKWHGILESLDVSQNTKLKELYCSGNKLTSLDVSENTNLELLFCDQNQLTSLDVSKSTKLRRLICRYNKLTSLDISNNTKLETMWCTHNNIGEICVWKGFNEKRYRDFSKDSNARYVEKQ